MFVSHNRTRTYKVLGHRPDTGLVVKIQQYSVRRIKVVAQTANSARENSARQELLKGVRLPVAHCVMFFVEADPAAQSLHVRIETALAVKLLSSYRK